MNTQITTLNEAGLTLRQSGLVQNERVEGKALLEICGFSYEDGNQNKVINDQIARHKLKSWADYIIQVVNFDRIHELIYHFTISAASQILLAAMTQEDN